MNVVETSGLTKRFGRTLAVDDLTLAVPEGSIFALLGPNGAGKTTTLAMLMNLVRPTAGRATVLGVDSRRLGPDTLARIGWVSEAQTLPGWMTVGRLIRFCRPLYPTWDDEFCERLRAQLALPLDAKLGALSRGMKMKAALLTALAYHPRLLLLDEPFSGLDVLVRDELIRGILELSEEHGWAVVVSSHDIDEVERLADGVGVMHAGRLTLAEPVATLQERCRRVEVTTTTPAARPPGPLPASWIDVAAAGHRVSFVDLAYRPGDTEADVTRIFGAGATCAATPMSLRELFLALARTYRLTERAEAA